MSFFAQISAYLTIATVAIMATGALLAGILFYLLKIKKITAKDEAIKYGNFDKLNILDYLRFDDVIEAGNKGNEFGIVKHGNTYTAILDISGYNFAEATTEEQESTMLKAISFASLIKEDIQLRQSVTSIQLTENIEEHNKILHEYEDKLIELDEEYKRIVRQIGDYEDDPDKIEFLTQLVDKAEEVKKKIEATNWLSRETQVLIEQMKILTGKGGEVQKSHQLIFSYVYNENDFTEELEEDEIKLRVMQELRTRAATYSRGLERCGCKCRTLSANEIIESFFEYMHPLNNTSDRFDEKVDNAIGQLVTTCDSLEDLKKRKADEQLYKNYVDEVEQYEMDLARQTRLEFRANGTPLIE